MKMALKVVSSSTVAILMILTIKIGGSCSKPQDFAGNCGTNYIKDGNMCIECPAGYMGDHCSELCPFPMYGSLCLQKCTCSPCHHIYGCNSTKEDTTECQVIDCSDVCPPSSNGPGCRKTCNCSECHHIYGCNVKLGATESTMIATKDGTENMTQAHGGTKTYASHFNTGKTIIILSGTFISVTLISLILREFYRYRRFITPVQEHNPAYVIYANVAEI